MTNLGLTILEDWPDFGLFPPVSLHSLFNIFA
jgi:hypothetical protein